MCQLCHTVCASCARMSSVPGHESVKRDDSQSMAGKSRDRDLLGLVPTYFVLRFLTFEPLALR